MPHKKHKRERMTHFNRLTKAPSRLNGKRASKSSHPHDFMPGPGGHTKPVEFSNADDTGVRDPSRIRHRQTKIAHKNRRMEQVRKDIEDGRPGAYSA